MARVTGTDTLRLIFGVWPALATPSVRAVKEIMDRLQTAPEQTLHSSDTATFLLPVASVSSIKPWLTTIRAAARLICSDENGRLSYWRCRQRTSEPVALRSCSNATPLGLTAQARGTIWNHYQKWSPAGRLP